MSTAKPLLLAAAGFIGGIVFVVACGGDDSPTDADAAAVCDCPTAETPITAERLQRVDNTGALPVGERTEVVVECPAQTILISGGCSPAGGLGDAVLVQSSPGGGEGWVCEWLNSDADPADGRAHAICLTPAQ